jgi:hypothetical protein
MDELAHSGLKGPPKAFERFLRKYLYPLFSISLDLCCFVSSVRGNKDCNLLKTLSYYLSTTSLVRH